MTGLNRGLYEQLVTERLEQAAPGEPRNGCQFNPAVASADCVDALKTLLRYTGIRPMFAD